MHDHELKKLLLETCPIRPGQEERAWTALKGHLGPKSHWSWLYYPSWRGTVVGLSVVYALILIGSYFGIQQPSLSLVSAKSQAPGVYATAFYSKTARAQVVWLNGLDPATDQPTYLDPSTEIHSTSAGKIPQSASEPDSL